MSKEEYMDALDKQSEECCKKNDCYNCPMLQSCRDGWEDACAEEYFYYKERGLR
jgi:hypothetical protein